MSAKMEPLPGYERTLASVLQGLGFTVFRVDGTFMAQAPQEVWHRIFDKVDPVSREVVVPAELADLVSRVVLLRNLSEPQSELDSGELET